MKNGFAFIVCVFFVLAIDAQKYIATQENAWLMYFGNHRFDEHWGCNTELQIRRADIFQDWQQSLVRFGVDYYTKAGVQFTLGYAWIKTYPYGRQPISHYNNEQRLWQQCLMTSKWRRFNIQHRYRLEQRFIENWMESGEGSFALNGYLYRQRVRYRFLLTVPLTRNELLDNTLFLAVSDEVFLGFGKGIAKNVLDQNRIYCAFGWRFNAACNIQLGYLNQFLIKKDGVSVERNHTAQFALTYNLDFRKEEELK